MDSGGQRRPAKESHLSCWIVKPFSGFSYLPKVPPTLEDVLALCPRIHTQYLGKVGDFRQMPQRIVGFLGRPAKQIHVKHILPGVPLDWARLNLGQTDIAQRKHAQSLEQSTGNVFHAEGNRCFVGTRQNLSLTANEKETSEVLLVVFYSRLQNLPSIRPRSPSAGD